MFVSIFVASIPVKFFATAHGGRHCRVYMHTHTNLPVHKTHYIVQ